MLEEQLIAARWGLYLNLGLLFGLPLFALFTGRDRDAATLPLRVPMAILAFAGLLLSAWSFVIMTASMMGAPLFSLDSATLRMVLAETNVGWAFIARMFALLTVMALAISSQARGRAALAGMTLVAGVALASLVWHGHGVATEGLLGTVHLVSDIVHLLAASAWIGALAAFLWATGASYRKTLEALETAHVALVGFATSGSIIVGLIVLTGIVNSAILVGPENVWALGASSYGRLLMIKLALFVVMLALAATNRFRLTPALRAGIDGGETDAAVVRLRRSLWLEVGAGILILIIVAWLGTLPPPATG